MMEAARMVSTRMGTHRSLKELIASNDEPYESGVMKDQQEQCSSNKP